MLGGFLFHCSILSKVGASEKSGAIHIQNIATYEETVENLALLQILAFGNQEIEQGQVKPITNVAAQLIAKPVAPVLLRFGSSTFHR